MFLTLPNIKYKDTVIEGLKEDSDWSADWIEIAQKDFSAFVEMFKNRRNGVGLPTRITSSISYWLIDGDEFVGHVSIRHHLAGKPETGSNHMGYRIRPSKQKMGYGTRILELGLQKAKEMGLDNVLIDTDEDNVGSRKVIERNGGILQGEELINGVKELHYVVNL